MDKNRDFYDRIRSIIITLESARCYFGKFLKDNAFSLGSFLAENGVNRWQRNTENPRILDWALIKVFPVRMG